MHYKLSYSNPSTQFIDIEFSVDVTRNETIVKLPLWRPGRYELGNFAKNVQYFQCFNEKGEKLEFSKVSKSAWKANTTGAKKLIIKYNYYAAELNAGSTFLNEEQLYVNPVNCCLYIDELLESPCTLELVIPDNYRVATGMKAETKNKYSLKDFHELADSPFIASATLQHNVFVLDGIEFNLWFQGICKPDWPKLINDFFIFINEQFVTMKEFTTDVYHFIFQILPHHFYHGVEHTNSTIIALGPGYDLMKKPLFDELLGISSHELYHSWNVKTIRATDMYPYDYSKENYSRLGFVCEGVTTYYGDFLLYRSGVFNDAEYFGTFNDQLDKHFNNPGRLNLSVADSSFDTWLDGYTPGVPNRKVSIYTEGCLNAFMLDVLIRKNTANKKGLEQVMQILYNEFARNNKGYTADEYRKIAEDVGGVSFKELFENHIYGNKDYKPLLSECLNHLGLKMEEHPSAIYSEAFLGFKCTEDGVVKNIFPSSISENAGLMVNDKIITLNSIILHNNLQQWLNYFSGKVFDFTVETGGRQRIIRMQKGENIYYKNYKIVKISDTTEEQKANFKAWSRREF